MIGEQDPRPANGLGSGLVGSKSAPRDTMLDAVVVGSGPNGLSAAVTLARAGRSVVVLEAHEEPGGGVRSAELTLPGFVHDVCSTVHPLAYSSPFFRSLALESHGVVWQHSSAPLAHVMDIHYAVSLERSVQETASQFGEDAFLYEDLLSPFVERFDELLDLVGPLRWPSDLGLALRFARKALPSMKTLATPFRDHGARGLLAGLAAHAMLPLDTPATFGDCPGFGRRRTCGPAGPSPKAAPAAITRALVKCCARREGNSAWGIVSVTFESSPKRARTSST